MILCDKSIPGGFRKICQTGEVTSLTATSWLQQQQQLAVMFHRGTTIQVSLTNPPKKHSKNMHTFTHSSRKSALKPSNKNLHGYTSPALKAVQAEIQIK